MSMLRILILVPELPDPLEKVKGGIQSAVMNLVRGFEHMEINVLVVSVSKNIKSGYRKQLFPNVTIAYIPEGPASFSFINYMFFSSFQIRKMIKEFEPDVVHFEEGMNFLLMRACVNMRRKHILTVHGITFAEAKLKKNFLQRMKWYQNGIVEWLFMPKHVIHISEYSKAIVPSSNKKPLPVIFNAVDSRFFKVSDNADPGNQLLYVGVINLRKNLGMLLLVLKQLLDNGKNFHLNVIGDFDPSESYKEEITSFIADNKLEQYISFLGWKSQKELLTYYESCDIVILPSLQETLPVVIAETMAAGRVMVASAVGGIPEMIDHDETGCLFENKNELQLYEILANLHNNKQLIRKIGQNARVAASNKFRSDVIAKKTKEYYQYVAGIYMPILAHAIINF
jgi:glycosyltransferase involved in cell wall biosynthesis